MTLLRSVLFSLLVAFAASFAQAQSETVDIGGLSVTFTTIDVPGAINTNVLGINSNGDMVGYYATTTNGPATGFLLRGGIFTFFDYPEAYSTEAFKINDSGLIAGTAFVAQGTGAVGFLYDGVTFTAIQLAGEVFTIVYGMNNGGIIVGGESGSSGNQAFELLGARFRNVTPPPGGFLAAYATGVNSLGRIVGLTTSASTSGFLYQGGRFRPINVPGNTGITEAWDINDSGIIVGSYESPSGFDGFALMRGKYVSISYPGANYTFVFGINKVGQIVGSYTFDQQTFHGFVTSPITADDFVTQVPTR